MNDTWVERDLLAIREQNKMLRTEVMRLRVRIAELELQRMIADSRDASDKAWLQGKVLRQARRLKALETEHALTIHLSKEAAEARAAGSPCGARHPTEDWKCVRDKGHDGEHGYAGVFWTEGS